MISKIQLYKRLRQRALLWLLFLSSKFFADKIYRKDIEYQIEVVYNEKYKITYIILEKSKIKAEKEWLWR